MTRAVPFACMLALTHAVFSPAADPPATPKPSPQGVEFFERKIRPLLVEKCQKCHGPDKQKGGLRLDSRAALLAGGDSGPALVPGNPEESLLVSAIQWKTPDYQMPPKDKLPDARGAEIAAWVKMGAPWPGGETTAPVAPKKEKGVTAEDRKHWSFLPVKKQAPPATRDKAWAVSPIDSFILAKLEAKGLRPNPAAGKRELLRRAYFDLVGLPPSPDQIDRFVRDTAPDAFAKVVDELLARPEYGERWGRHWLDVVRYGQTDGYERDNEKPNAWRYRDYVVTAFNRDLPYDRFVLEQLAGDELDDGDESALVATGFYRIGVADDEPDDPRAAEYDGLDDVVVTTSAAFLGITVGCARCHDHKIDPVPQTDYYRILALIRNVRPYAKAEMSLESPTQIPLGMSAQMLKESGANESALRAKLAAAKDAEEQKKAKAELDRHVRRMAKAADWALAVRDGAAKPTHVLIRGNAGTPGEKVEGGFPEVLGGEKAKPVPPKHGRSSGGRLALARWLANDRNPLVARVAVNRVWKHHFGRGIVATTTDFGKGGTPPTHPELLDWLAEAFVADGWSMKKLHRRIMLSRTYQLSSRTENAAALAADPANDLRWRQDLRRLEAEAIRDSILSVSGRINAERGGRGFFPHAAGEVLAGGSRPGDGWETSSDKQQDRRSIYAFVKRSLMPPFFESFDYSNTAVPLGERQITTVAPQALMLLNDKFIESQSAALAERLRKEAGADPNALIERLYRLSVGRAPTPSEASIARSFLDRETAAQLRLAARRTFVPDVPGSLHSAYLGRLKPPDVFLGPTSDWTYGRGKWGGAYEGIVTLDRRRGPYALWNGPAFLDGSVSVGVSLERATESASLLLRAEPDGDFVRGYEILFEPRERRASLVRHAGERKVLATEPWAVPTGKPFPVKIRLAGDYLEVVCGEKGTALVATDPDPLPAGRAGVRSWGAAVSLDDLQVETGGKSHRVETGGCAAESAQRALASLCAVAFNLNEFVYVD